MKLVCLRVGKITRKKIQKTLKKVLTFYLDRGNINIVAGDSNKHKIDRKLTQKNKLKKLKKSVDNISKRC